MQQIKSTLVIKLFIKLSSFLEIELALIILAIFGKFWQISYIDKTEHEWFGQIVCQAFANITQN